MAMYIPPACHTRIQTVVTKQPQQIVSAKQSVQTVGTNNQSTKSRWTIGGSTKD